MRGTKAKKLRKDVYADKDYRTRKYSEIVHNTFNWMDKTYVIKTVVSDKARRWYQNSKNTYSNFTKTQKGKKVKITKGEKNA